MVSHTRQEDLAFLSVPSPTLKQLNRAMALMVTYEFNDGLADLSWLLVRRKALDSDSLRQDEASSRVPLATDALTVHDFAGQSKEQIAAAVVANDGKITAAGLDSHIWLIIDQRGLDTDTVLFGERPFDEDKDAIGDDSRYTRLPMEVAWEMYANLSIANMDFEEYVDIEDESTDEPGVFKFTFDYQMDPKVKRRRDEALQKLRDDGAID